MFRKCAQHAEYATPTECIRLHALGTSQAMNRLAFVVIVGDDDATVAAWNNLISVTHEAPNVPAIRYTSAQIKRILAGLGATLCMENCNNMDSLNSILIFQFIADDMWWRSIGMKISGMQENYYYLGFSLFAEPVL